jgi:wobble nucleotide-excising tRNase
MTISGLQEYYECKNPIHRNILVGRKDVNEVIKLAKEELADRMNSGNELTNAEAILDKFFDVTERHSKFDCWLDFNDKLTDYMDGWRNEIIQLMADIDKVMSRNE